LRRALVICRAWRLDIDFQFQAVDEFSKSCRCGAKLVSLALLLIELRPFFIHRCGAAKVEGPHMAHKLGNLAGVRRKQQRHRRCELEDPAVRVGRQWRFRKRDIDAWLDSQRPRGTTRAAAAAPARPLTGATRPRVLVVDDEASIRDLLSKTLALAEYEVDVAPDGRSALERMRMYPYDLLIADLKMPGMDGLTVIREAKRYKVDLPVIIITGFSTESSAIEAVNLGVAGWFPKWRGERRGTCRRFLLT